MSSRKIKNKNQDLINDLYKKADDSFTNFMPIELEENEEYPEVAFELSERCEVTFKGVKSLSTRYLFTSEDLKEGTKLSFLSQSKVLAKVAKMLEKGNKVIVSKNEHGHWRINLAE